VSAYTLFAQAVTLANAGNASPQLTFTTEFTLTSAASLTGIWFYSPSGAAGLPDQCVLFDTSTQAEVSGTLNASPSWSGAAASGWVKCSYSGVALTSGHTYLAAVHVPPASSDGYGKTAAFWTTGTGSGGIVSGPLSAPNYSTSTLQGAVASGQSTITYPTITESGAWFGVDVEVSTATAHSVSGTLTVTPSLAGERVRGKYRAGSLTVTPGFSGGKSRGHYRAGTLPVSPQFSASRVHGHGRSGSLTVTPSLTGSRSQGHVRHGSLLVTPSLAGLRSAGHHRSGSLLIVPVFQGTVSGGAVVAPSTGSWWGLVSVLRHNQQEFDAYQSMVPLACPRCGEPLSPAPNTPAGAAVERYCRYDGWRYPQDYVRPSRPVSGRPGVL